MMTTPFPASLTTPRLVPPLAAVRALFAAAKDAATTTLQAVQNGRRARLNIENFHPLKNAGFPVGTRVAVQYAPGRIEIRPDPTGSIVIAPKKQARRDGRIAVGERLDIRAQRLHDHFGGQADLLVLYLDQRLVVLHLPTVVQATERAARLADAVARGTLTTASLYTGIGTLDAALDEGFTAGGLQTETAFVNELWPAAMTAYLADNPARRATTRSFTMGIEQLIAMDGAIPTCDFLHLGIPCKGASRLNVAQRDEPERHPKAGHQVLNACVAINQAKPGMLLIENVLEWADTVSCDMLRRMLHEQGYDTVLLGDHQDDGTYTGLNATDYGTMERRRRMALLAYPQGLTLETLVLQKRGPSTQTVADIRMPEAAVDPVEYTKGAHLFRDEKAAKGWRTRVAEDADTSVPPIGASIWKQQIECVRFTHPDDARKTRIPLPEEHARLKGHDAALIGMLSHNSVAHTALGNGTAKGPWVALGEALATWLRGQRDTLARLAQGIPAVTAPPSEAPTLPRPQADLFGAGV